MEFWLKLLEIALGPIVAVIGILIALPIIRKKLIENHIVKVLNNIQESNSQLLIETQRLIDKYQPFEGMSYKLSKVDCENVLKDLERSFVISQNACNEAVTLLHFLKLTLKQYLVEFSENTTKPFFSKGFLTFVIDILDSVNFYTTQAIPVPKSVETQRSDLIKRPIRKFFTNSEIIKYRHFKIGIDFDSHSALFAIFLNKAINSGNTAIMRSSFIIHNNHLPIAKILYNSNIYAAPVLFKPIIIPIKGMDGYVLKLIGYNYITKISKNNEQQKFVDLVYTNSNFAFNFQSYLTEEKFKLEFYDNWILDSGFLMSEAIGPLRNDIKETYRIQFELSYLQRLHKKNCRKIKGKIKLPKERKLFNFIQLCPFPSLLHFLRIRKNSSQ